MAATQRQLPSTVADFGDPSARRLLTVLLGRYGIPVAETVTADSAESAVEAAWWLGFPVTLVAEGAHPTGRATRLGLATPAQVRAAYWQLAVSLGPAMTGVRMRRQPQQGAEVVVQITRDDDGGARLTLRLGGPAAALVGTTVTRDTPVSARGAGEMLAEMHGPGGNESVALDVAALAALLERVSRLAVAVRDVAELELNPVIVTASGVAVAGVRGRFRRARNSRPKLRSVS